MPAHPSADVQSNAPAAGTPARRHLGAGIVLAIALVVSGGGCTEESSGPELATETYIDLMVKLRLAQDQSASEVDFASRRDSILREAGVTDSTLVRWVRTQGADVIRLSAIWDTINTRLIAARDTFR